MASATLTEARRDSGRLARLRAVDASTWALVGFAALCLGALVGYFAYPTFPTYDSFYALLWGRNLLHLHLPDFAVYRGPTEHPLAIAFGMVCSIFGQGGARLMVLGSIASFVAVVAGMYRMGRICFGPVVGLFAALLVLSRFFVENLSAQGYLDIPYVALIVWAVVLELERPRRGLPVLALLAAAGMLRPEAWVLGGVYWVWWAWPRRLSVSPSGGTRARASTLPEDSSDRGPSRAGPTRARALLWGLGLVALAPVVWIGLDAVVTGDALYSLHSTAGLAHELERSQGVSGALASVWTFGVRIDKLAVIVGALIGMPIAVWLAPRRAVVPLAAVVLLVCVFVAEGAAGASVIDRYLLGASIVALLFCAVAIGGWAMLLPGTLVRRVWIVGALALIAYGGAKAANTVSLSSLRTTLAYHNDFHEELARTLADTRVRAALASCPLVSLPDNKLIPDARWILDRAGQHDVVARSQARADARRGGLQLQDRLQRGSVAVYPLGSAVFFEAIVDVGDDPRDQVPQAGYHRIYTSRYYAVYDNC